MTPLALHGVPRNGLSPETAFIIRAVDLCCEANHRARMAEAEIFWQALSLSEAWTGGSTRGTP